MTFYRPHFDPVSRGERDRHGHGRHGHRNGCARVRECMGEGVNGCALATPSLTVLLLQASRPFEQMMTRRKMRMRSTAPQPQPPTWSMTRRTLALKRPCYRPPGL